MKRRTTTDLWMLSLTVLLAVSGCHRGGGGNVGAGGSGGGGGGGGNAPPAPVLAWTPTSIKTYRFTWTDVSGETDYRLLENPDGVSGFLQVATIGADTVSYDLEVFLPGRLNASYILQACNASACASSARVFVSGNLAQAVGYAKASNTGLDGFGFTLALDADGDTLAVGAPFESSGATGVGGDQGDDSAFQSGAVYVFTRSAGSWTQQAYVKASNTGTFDRFGESLALAGDGDTLAIGAHLEDSNATGIGGNQGDDSAPDSGAVYVFTRSAGTWTQQAYVKASNTDARDEFGFSVALAADGNTLAVGAYSEDSSATGVGGNESDNSALGGGAVYVFTRSAGSWAQQAFVKASNTDGSDSFGFNLALTADGATLAVGAVGEDSNATGIGGSQGNNLPGSAGAVYVFTRNAGTWAQQAYVKASNTDGGDAFGISVALDADGNTLAVGALDDSNATGIGGNQGDNSAIGSGAVYVFTRSAGTWTQQAYVKASNTDQNDQFGASLALAADGDTLAVGARLEAGNATGIGGNQSNNSAVESGAVYIFNRSAGIWAQQAYVKASNPDGGDRFGQSLAVAADGDTLAVGAYVEASNATGIGGDQIDNSVIGSGAVYIY